MAKCPFCKNIVLQPTQLENSLPVLECNSCSGTWIRANDYSIWLKSQKPGNFDESKNKEASSRFPVTEANKAAVCPDCGHFLRKYKIGSSIDFHLDRCNSCNGVWLERNEWQILKMVDLHDEINQMFTKPWQQHIRDEVAAKKLDVMYLEKFGEDDYKKIKEIRIWLQDNPNYNALIAFLLEKEPFSY